MNVFDVGKGNLFIMIDIIYVRMVYFKQGLWGLQIS